jgi:large subunit ribosomal protein L21
MSTTPATGTSAPSTDSPAPGAGTYVIVEASGQQFWLQPNRYYDLDRIAAEVDESVTLENVLLVRDGSGVTTLGHPYVSGATVQLKVLEHRRGPKIIVYKMRPKKKTRRKNGHRQELTRVRVESITVAGKALA